MGREYFWLCFVDSYLGIDSHRPVDGGGVVVVMFGEGEREWSMVVRECRGRRECSEKTEKDGKEGWTHVEVGGRAEGREGI